MVYLKYNSFAAVYFKNNHKKLQLYNDKTIFYEI